jgi:hypothetical protein
MHVRHNTHITDWIFNLPVWYRNSPPDGSALCCWVVLQAKWESLRGALLQMARLAALVGDRCSLLVAQDLPLCASAIAAVAAASLPPSYREQLLAADTLLPQVQMCTPQLLC